MSWEQVAGSHLNHKAFLKSLYELRCVECAMTLVIHREPRAVGSSGPPPYRRPDNPALRPMPAGLKERTLAEIRERKRMSQTPPEDAA